MKPSAKENIRDFPISISFPKGNWRKDFASVEEVQKWGAAELDAWFPYAQQGNLSHIIRSNREQLNQANLGQAKTPEEAYQKLEGIRNNYLPFASVSQLVSALNNQEQSVVLLAETIQSGSVQNNINTSAAIAVATLFKAYGSPHDLLSSIRGALAEIESVRGSYAAIHKQFQDQLQKSQADCQLFFDTFTKKLALAEPRKYWEDRAKKHEQAANSATKVWNASLIVVGIAITTFGVLGALGKVDFSISAGSAAWAVLAERVATVGTVLGFVVWWLRQKLRDVRSNEHLAEDAAERVTMIDTYSALNHRGLQGADLAPILTALYRPASTGLLDDGGPVLPIEVFLKTVAGTVGKGTH